MASQKRRTLFSLVSRTRSKEWTRNGCRVRFPTLISERKAHRKTTEMSECFLKYRKLYALQFTENCIRGCIWGTGFLRVLQARIKIGSIYKPFQFREMENALLRLSYLNFTWNLDWKGIRPYGSISPKEIDCCVLMQW